MDLITVAQKGKQEFVIQVSNVSESERRRGGESVCRSRKGVALKGWTHAAGSECW